MSVDSGTRPKFIGGYVRRGVKRALDQELHRLDKPQSLFLSELVEQHLTSLGYDLRDTPEELSLPLPFEETK